MADDTVLAEFIERPCADTFLRLREAVVAAPSYDFHAIDGLTLAERVAAGDLDAVPAALAELMPDWLLSPLMHGFAEQAARHSGDADGAARAAYFGHACLLGLLDSGDGSRQRPYRVTHVADEYDLLDALGKQLVSQWPVQGDDGLYDVMRCSDGSELWFDASLGVRTGF